MTSNTSRADAAMMSTDAANPATSSSQALQDYQAESRERYRIRLDAIRPWLISLGVAGVRIEYDGCGDSGQIEELTFQDKDKRLLVLNLSDAQHDELTQFFYDLLESRYGGWEDGDGGSGAFEWTLRPQSKLTHDHYEREVIAHHRFEEGV